MAKVEKDFCSAVCYKDFPSNSHITFSSQNPVQLKIHDLVLKFLCNNGTKVQETFTSWWAPFLFPLRERKGMKLQLNLQAWLETFYFLLSKLQETFLQTLTLFFRMSYQKHLKMSIRRTVNVRFSLCRSIFV